MQKLTIRKLRKLIETLVQEEMTNEAKKITWNAVVKSSDGDEEFDVQASNYMEAYHETTQAMKKAGLSGARITSIKPSY